MSTTSKIDQTKVFSTEIVQALQSDHRDVVRLFENLIAAAPGERRELFWNLVPKIVQHEVAEEIVVYPKVRSEFPSFEEAAEERLSEQADAEHRLVSLERLDPMSAEFAHEASELALAVLAHAQAEEREMFPLLEQIPVDERRDLGSRYETAKSKAPTHPHPNAPDTPPANKIVGPMAALFDRTRDALRNSI